MKSDARIRRGAMAVIVMAALWLWAGMAAAAATVTVTNGADAGAGSLRDEVGSAGSGDTITFDPGVATVTIGGAAIVVNDSGLTITGNTDGSGKPATTIASSPNPRTNPIFGNTENAGSGLTLENLVFDGIHIQLRQNGNVALRGGGIVSAYSLSTAATLGSLGKVSFADNTITIGAGSFGGGLAGAYSNTGAATVGAIGPDAFFTDNTVKANGSLHGGGLVGARSYSGAATVGAIGQNASFTGNAITAGLSFYGGGLVGAYSHSGAVATVGAIEADASFRGNEVGTDSYLYGGGLVGAYSYYGAATVDSIGANASFTGNTVEASMELYGGGLVGVRSSSGAATVGAIGQDASFANNTVSVGTSLAGGGVLGAYGNNIDVSASLGDVNGASFTDNLVDVGEKANRGKGYALGGVIGASGLHDTWTIDGVTITNNSLTVHNHNTAVTAGTIYIGTDRNTTNNSHDVRVTGNTTISGNTITYSADADASNDAFRNSSFHFGRGWDTISNPDILYDSLADATLTLAPAAGETVTILDPISTDINNGKSFTLTQSSGDFLWGGANLFDSAGGDTVNLTGGTMRLADDFSLDRGTKNASGLLDFNVSGGNLASEGAAGFKHTTLNVSGGKLTVGLGSTLTLDTDSTLTLNNTTLSFALGEDNASGKIVSQNADTAPWFTGTNNTLDIAAWAPGIYTLLESDKGMTIADIFNDITVGGMALSADIRNAIAVTKNNNATELYLTVNAISNRKVTWGDVGSAWDFSNGQWLETAAASTTSFRPNDYVTFDENGINQKTVTLNGNTALVSGMNVTDAARYVFKDGYITGREGTASGLALSGGGNGVLLINNGAEAVFKGVTVDFDGGVHIGDENGAGAVILTGGGKLAGSMSVSLGHSDSLLGFDIEAADFTSGYTYAGAISGSGSLTKEGTGTLTLSDANIYTGGTTISGGTLALTGSLATTRLSMHGGTTFDFSNGTVPTSITRLDVQGVDAKLLGSGKTLDFSGKTISFNVGGIGSGQTMLIADNSLLLDSSALVELTNLADATLSKGQSATLVNGLADGSVFDTLYTRGGRFKYSLGMSGLDLRIANIGIFAFRPYSDIYFTPLGFNNANLQNGASHLDWLNAHGNAGPALMDAFDAAYALGGRAAATALEQMYGGYAAYANTGLQTSADRFRSLWQRRNASHLLDRHIFANPDMSGVMSPDALASPAYGPRDMTPPGRSRIWASGFGSWAEQNASENLSGYKWDARGFALGYEYSFNNCLQIGFGAAYSKGELEVSRLRYENTPDIVNLALYGVYAHPSGFYAQGGVGYGHAWNEYGVNMLLGGKKNGKYVSDDWSANLELGYAAKLPHDFTLIPSIGIEYDRLRNNGWMETTSGNPTLIANRFDGDSDDSLALPLGLRFNKPFRFGANGYAVPEVRAAYVYQADASRPSIAAGYSGAPGSAPMVGVKPTRNHWRLGAGVSGGFNERIDFRVDYDFDARSGFRGHNLLASMGVSF